MALTSSQKTGYAICLILTILLIGLHYAVATHGYHFAQDLVDDSAINSLRLRLDSNLYLKQQKQEAAFIIIAAGLTFFISLILLFGLCTDCISPKFRHFLSAFNLVLELAIAVVIGLRASNNSNLRDAYPWLEDQYSNFKYYYRLSIADAVITFVLEIVYLLVIFFGTLDETIYREVVTPVVADVPLSNRHF